MCSHTAQMSEGEQEKWRQEYQDIWKLVPGISDDIAAHLVQVLIPVVIQQEHEEHIIASGAATHHHLSLMRHTVILHRYMHVV